MKQHTRFAHQLLTAKQHRFVLEYLRDYNGTQAAIRAGYAPKNARRAAQHVLAHTAVSRLLRRKAQVRLDKLELSSEQTIERYRRIAASSTSALYHPTEKRMRRLDELPMEIHTAIEAVKCAPDGTIISVKFWNKLEALKFLARTQELAGAQEPVMVGSAQSVTNVFLADCTTDELKVLERVLERHERLHGQKSEFLNQSLPEDAIDTTPVKVE
jgi:phage terminase small subunit